MRRRDLCGGRHDGGRSAGRRLRAQPPVRRAAVVIGVNKAGDLPPLKAAVSGAREVAAWLTTEGLDVSSS